MLKKLILNTTLLNTTLLNSYKYNTPNYITKLYSTSKTSNTDNKPSLSSKYDIITLDKKFKSYFPILSNEFINYIENYIHYKSDIGISRIKKMLEYTCVGGKLVRGITVLTATQYLTNNDIEFEKLLDSSIRLGWSIEILQTMFLVADDMMDASILRRGLPCWHTLPNIGLDAINDTLILFSFCNHILSPYPKITALMNEINLATQLGQLSDLTTAKQMHNFNRKNYENIVIYKTALYTFYLPLACAIVLTHNSNSKHALEDSLKLVKEFSILMGRLFQMQDDYLDVYGDPKVIGKVGTDLQDGKLTWLIVAAIESDPNFMDKVNSHFGKKGCEDFIKKEFERVGVPKLYLQAEENEIAAIEKLMNAQDILPESLWRNLLAKTTKRQK